MLSSDDGDGLVLCVDGRTYELAPSAAASLRDDLTEALSARREFLHTSGEHRTDGSYVVSRRGADSAGHSKVFERFRDLETLYAELPGEFTAQDVGRRGLTGGRRHLLVHHLTEHPAFDCDLVRRQPLTARKRCSGGIPGEDGGETAPAD